MVELVKNSPAMQETACNARDPGSISGSGRYPGGGAWQPTPVFLPGEPMERGAWWATVHGAEELDMT